MAFIRCESGGGGSVVAVTTLWTNPNPANDFASQNVTLNDSIQNFDLIEFKFKADKTSGSAESSVCYHVEDVDKWSNQTISANPTAPFLGGLCGRVNASYFDWRPIHKVSDTQLNFHEVQQSGGGANITKALIPVSITGIKYT